MKGAAVLLGLTFVLYCGGCGDGKKTDPEFEVSGNVTFNGAALSEGTITFDASDGKPPASADIKAGAYSMKARPGKHKVSISFQKLIPGKKGPMDTEVREEQIPAKYNTETILTAEVKADGENKFTFDLKK